ncbi:MAG: hypothetical protein ACJASQ_003085 [Crocinitomicaceae bacterium]|jgi:hypothetical protein
MSGRTYLKRLIIVGNGIDIALGLKTGYKDFLCQYTKEKLRMILSEGKETSNSNMVFFTAKNFKVLGSTGYVAPHKKSTSTYLSIEKRLREVVDQLDSIHSFDRLKKVLKEKYLSVDGGDLYEALVSHIQWCDVEKTYYDLLAHRFETNRTNGVDRSSQRFQIYQLNLEFEDMKISLERFILSEQEKISPYLGQTDAFKGMIEILCWSHRAKQENVKVLNFNYTDTILQALNEHDYNDVEVINIHGSITDSQFPIVFGFGDDTDERYRKLEDAEENEYLRHSKASKYSINDSYARLLNFLTGDGESYDVHIVGHSCGLSDRTMLKTVFDQSLCKEIHVYHYQEDEQELIDAQIEKDINIARHFDNKVRKRDVLQPLNPELKIPQYRITDEMNKGEG